MFADSLWFLSFFFFVFAQLIERLSEHTHSHTHTPGVGITLAALGIEPHVLNCLPICDLVCSKRKQVNNLSMSRFND